MYVHPLVCCVFGILIYELLLGSDRGVPGLRGICNDPRGCESRCV